MENTMKFDIVYQKKNKGYACSNKFANIEVEGKTREECKKKITAELQTWILKQAQLKDKQTIQQTKAYEKK